MQTLSRTNGAARTNGGRFASLRADLEEQVVDYQAELDELAKANLQVAREVVEEIRQDEADDRRRFTKYRAVEQAIRVDTTEIQLFTFHELVAHIEADELREDERRRGRVGAHRLLSGKAVHLRRIFRTDFVPLILAAYAKGGRR